MLAKKTTYFENHPYQKKITKKITQVKRFSIFSLFLLARCETALTSQFVPKLACFNFLSNVEPAKLLNSELVIYLA